MKPICATPRELDDLLDERLPADQIARLDKHLRDCPICLARLERLTREREKAELPGLNTPDLVSEDSMPTLAPPADDTELEIPAGTSVGPYDLLRELGRGGMGIVYEARHRDSGRVSALKVLAIPTLARRDGAARFAAEVRAMSRVKHAGIVEIHDAGVWMSGAGQPPVPYAAIELVPGPSLRAVLADGPLDIIAAARLVESIARAVHHAHEKGVIHRDLKPANILLWNAEPGTRNAKSSEDDRDRHSAFHIPHSALRPKVSDFGLAKLLDENCGLTGSRDLLGTPEYMAPELGNQDRAVGPAVDIYALGVILYECLTGEVPFRGATPLKTLLIAHSRKAPAPSRLRAEVPRELDAIVLRCMEKSPDDRFESAEELANALRAFRKGEMKRHSLWSRPRVVFAGVIVAAIVGIALFAIARKKSPAAPTPETPAPVPVTPVALPNNPAPLVKPALVLPQAPSPKAAVMRCPKPTEFITVFSIGYGGDSMPKDDAIFDKLVGKLKDGGFNVVHCSYTDARLKACKKHGLKMMVDLLAPEHHIYKDVEAAKALCTKLRGESGVWGYNIWNDAIGKTAEGRMRDIANIRTWDPTHPAFCGTRNSDGMSGVTNPDAIGYYDYHWKRNRDWNFQHLLRFTNWVGERDAIFLRWIETDAGLAGQGNPNRARYTLNTSIACGAKGVMWFLGTKQVDMRTLEWTQFGKDAIGVNADVAPMRAELMKIGNPIAVYSTTISRTLNNDPIPDGKKPMPPGLERSVFPADFWAKPVAGEFVAGVFKDSTDKTAPDRLFIANHNAYLDQEVTLTLPKPRKVWLFSRKSEKWEPLEVRNVTVTFKLAGGSGELLRFE